MQKKAKKATVVELNKIPVVTPTQMMIAEQQEEIGVHPTTREFLNNYDAAIAQAKQAIITANEQIKQLEFAKAQLLRLEIAKEGYSVAVTKPFIETTEGYATVKFWLPARRATMNS